MADETSEPEDCSELTPDQEAAQFHLAMVGSIAGDWALFETFLDGYALTLANFDNPLGYCFTAQVIGSARKLDAYIAVARARGAKKHNGELDQFAKDTAALAERRNRVVHDPWKFETGLDPKRLEITARRKLRTEWIPVSSAELIELNRAIQGHVDRFCELHDRIAAEIETLRGKPR